MGKLVFRKLRADEIEVRIGSTTKKTFSLLLYKDARVDMNLLDEVVGPENWQRKHYTLGNDVYCSVGVYYEDRGWVWKDDAGSSGSIEVEKSKASDSFKRACVNATGVGRELYTSPEIKIWKKDESDESYKYAHYFVKEIDYKDNEISKLVICNEENGEVVFSYPKGTKVSQNAEKPQKNNTLEEIGKGIGDSFLEESTISQETRNSITEITGKFDTDRYNNFKTYIKNVFGVESIGDLTEKQGKQLLKAIGKK